jgi:hypothetical protein
MRLFLNKEEREGVRLARLTTLLSHQHHTTIKYVIANIMEFTNLNDALDTNSGVLNGLYIWHDALVVTSQTGIKDKAKEEQAADLLWAYGQALVESGDVTMAFNDYTKAVSDACSAYMEAHKTVREHGMAIPSLRLARSIKQLEKLDIPMEAAVLRLPEVEQYALASYKKFWAANF